MISLLLLVACTSIPKRNPSSEKKRLLVFGRTNRPAHIHIVPGAIKHLVSHFQGNNFEAIGSQELSSLTKESLTQFDAVVFVDVSNDILSDENKMAVENFVSTGKGLLAIHASIAAGNDWDWFRDMIGTSFTNHPPIQEATVSISDVNHASTKNLTHQWPQTDEWYNFTSKLGPDHQVLATVDEQSYKGGTMGNDHPITWVRRDQKVWFTAMGHDESLYANHESAFMNHILKAAIWLTDSN